MKKLLLIVGIVLFSVNYAHSQEQQMKVGGNLAFPTGDLGDISSIGLHANFSYLFAVEGRLQAGPMASLQYYNTKKHYKDWWFLPIGGEARFNLNDFFVGTDLGYGIGIAPTGNNGGFFYRPKVGYNLGNPNMGLIVSYSGVSLKHGNANSINLGVEFTL